MKNICFIINPISGTRKKDALVNLIHKYLDTTQWEPTIVFTEYQGHAVEISRQYAEKGYYAVVAIGGDGTLNEVARGLVGTNTALGIIPMGSGNGFARHVEIPINARRAIEILNHSERIEVDYGLANNMPFFSTCGTGFDAVIAQEFAHKHRRGLTTYITTMIENAFKYSAGKYTLVGEGIHFDTDALVITCANANQWGYGAMVAPQASIQDGKMDVVVISKIPMVVAPMLALTLFSKKIGREFFMHSLQTDEITIVRQTEGPFHIDGDPHLFSKDIHIKIVPRGLNLLVRRRY